MNEAMERKLITICPNCKQKLDEESDWRYETLDWLCPHCGKTVVIPSHKVICTDIMNKQKLNSIYGLHLDETGNFLSGAILGYCQTRTPEEVAKLFNPTFTTLPTDKACSIASCITGRMLIICSNKEEDK